MDRSGEERRRGIRVVAQSMTLVHRTLSSVGLDPPPFRSTCSRPVVLDLYLILFWILRTDKEQQQRTAAAADSARLSSTMPASVASTESAADRADRSRDQCRRRPSSSASMPKCKQKHRRQRTEDRNSPGLDACVTARWLHSLRSRRTNGGSAES